MSELKRITRNELIINLLALYYGVSVDEVNEIAKEEIRKQKQREAQKQPCHVKND